MNKNKLLPLSAVLAITLVACTAPAPTPAPAKPAQPAAPAAPKHEGKLTVLCTVTEDWCNVQTKAFESKTGIKTSFVRLSSGEAATKIRATKSNPEFSVWWGGPADGFISIKGDGVLESYKSPNANKISAAQKDPDGMWTGIYVGALGFCSNKVEMDKLGLPIPSSWNELLDPKLKGKFSIAHPATSGTSYTTVWTMMTLNNFDEAKTFDYFKKLHPNVFQYTKSGVAPAQTVGKGEAAAGVVFSHDCVAAIESGFKDLVVSFAKEGTGYEIGGMALIKGGPEPVAGKMWVDWALTAEAQELGGQAKAYQLPTNPDAKVHPKAVKLSELKLVSYEFTKAGEARKALTAKFEEQIAAQPK
jgi:iron(III) transport system substrate-binding protein